MSSIIPTSPNRPTCGRWFWLIRFDGKENMSLVVTFLHHIMRPLIIKLNSWLKWQELTSSIKLSTCCGGIPTDNSRSSILTSSFFMLAQALTRILPNYPSGDDRVDLKNESLNSMYSTEYGVHM